MYQNCRLYFSLHDYKGRLNGFMHLLAPACEEVLSPGVAFNFVTSEVSQSHLSCCGAVWPELCVCAVKPMKAQPKKDRSKEIFQHKVDYIQV